MGTCFSKDGISPDPKKVEDVVNLQTPSTATSLFGRPMIMKTKLPELTTPCSEPEIRERDQTAKAKMKEYADNKRYVKPSNAKEGDTVLVKRDDSKKKSDTPYDPRPLIIVEKKGSMVRKR